MSVIFDYISINDIFWIQFKMNLISFGFKGLPDKTHFTIVFDSRNPDINFHVTKNTANKKDKPQIKIVIIDKKLLEEVIPSIMIALLNKVLKPFNIKEYKDKFDYNLGFVSFESLQNSMYSYLNEQQIIDGFKDISRIKQKTRLKVEGEIETRIENFANSKELQNRVLDNIVELSDDFTNVTNGGIILTEDKLLQVIQINEKWFTIRNEIKPFDILCAFVNPNLAQLIIWKTKRALISLKNANKYSDTQHLNKPIRLVKRSKL